MTRCIAQTDMTEVAVLYALGALSQQEAASFEKHLSEGCDACRSELESFESTVGALGFSAPDAQPPDRTRAKLLARIATSSVLSPAIADREPEPFVSILASEGEWRTLMDGVLIRKLYLDGATGIATSLVRMMPGTSLPAHRHSGVEQLFILEGDCQIAGVRLKAGDYHRAEAGSTHQSTSTIDGTLFLLIAPEHYEIGSL